MELRKSFQCMCSTDIGFAKNLPFTWRSLEIDSLIALLGIDPMRINRMGHIIILHDHAVTPNKCLCNHVRPLVRKPLRFLLVSVPQEACPREHLLRRPAVREFPLPIRAVNADRATRLFHNGDQATVMIEPRDGLFHYGCGLFGRSQSSPYRPEGSCGFIVHTLLLDGVVVEEHALVSVPKELIHALPVFSGTAVPSR